MLSQDVECFSVYFGAGCVFSLQSLTVCRDQGFFVRSLYEFLNPLVGFHPTSDNISDLYPPVSTVLLSGDHGNEIRSIIDFLRSSHYVQTLIPATCEAHHILETTKAA